MSFPGSTSSLFHHNRCGVGRVDSGGAVALVPLEFDSVNEVDLRSPEREYQAKHESKLSRQRTVETPRSGVEYEMPDLFDTSRYPIHQ